MPPLPSRRRISNRRDPRSSEPCSSIPASASPSPVPTIPDHVTCAPDHASRKPPGHDIEVPFLPPRTSKSCDVRPPLPSPPPPPRRLPFAFACASIAVARVERHPSPVPIYELPLGHPGRVGGSMRWLLVFVLMLAMAPFHVAHAGDEDEDDDDYGERLKVGDAALELEGAV